MTRANETLQSSKPSRVARWARLVLYCSAIALVAIFATTRSLAAEAGERSLVFGRQLGKFELFAGRSTDVVLNGQQLTLDTRVVQRPIHDVLNDFASACRAGGERLASEFIEHTGGGKLEVAALQRLLVMRDERADAEGTALCFAGLGQGSLAELTTRFARFGQTLDLSELGALRYAYLHKTEHGTHVIFVTSAGPLSLEALSPRGDRDVAGPEAIAGARPKDSVRFVSARLANAPKGFTAYRTQHAAAESLEDYANQVRAGGYEVLDFAAVGGGEKSLGLDEGVDLRVLRKGADTLIATSVPYDAGSFLTVVQL